MKEHFQKTFDRIAPNTQTRDRMLQNIQMKARARRTPEFSPLRRFLTAAACVSLALLLSGLGFAAYRKWHLPAPKPYTPDEGGGVYRMHSAETYTAPVTTASAVQTGTAAATSSAVTSAQSTETAPAALTDEDFIRKAVEILQLVGLRDVQSEQLTVVRQEHLYWAREEAEVHFTEDENHTSVTFNAETGALLGLSSIDWAIDGAAACKNDAEAEKLATRYYEALPIPQGYVLTDCDKYDAQYWSFSFCREVREGLFSVYEAAKIAVNPQTGRLTGCTTFYVPLLDDHGAEDKPLTAEEAEAIARNCPHLRLEKYGLKSSDLTVVLPNWWYTDKMAEGLNAQSSDVTRLAWTLIFENPTSEFADMVTVYVDSYTGEILGGDMT